MNVSYGCLPSTCLLKVSDTSFSPIISRLKQFESFSVLSNCDLKLTLSEITALTINSHFKHLLAHLCTVFLLINLQNIDLPSSAWDNAPQTLDMRGHSPFMATETRYGTRSAHKTENDCFFVVGGAHVADHGQCIPVARSVTTGNGREASAILAIQTV